MCNLLRKTSLDIVDTIADCNESKVQVDNDITKIKINATNQPGILDNKMKNALYPSTSPTTKSPAQTVRNL